MAPTNPADTNVPDADDKDEDSDAAEALRNAGVSDAEIEAAIAAIRVQKADDLPRRPYPSLPNLAAGAPMSAKIAAMQALFVALGYGIEIDGAFGPRSRQSAIEVLAKAGSDRVVVATFEDWMLIEGMRGNTSVIRPIMAALKED